MTADAPDDGRDEFDRSREDSTDAGDERETEWQWVDPARNDRAASDDPCAADARATDDDRIPLDLSGGTTETDAEDDGTDEDDPYAPEPSSTPIERGNPSIEHSVFVVLGALAMLLVIVRLVSIPF